MTTREEALAHFGVKGMKWGVIRDKAAAGDKRAQRRIDRADKKFARKANNDWTAIKIHDEAARAYNKTDLDRINNSPKFRDKDFTRDSPLRKAYYKAHQDAFLNQLEKAANTRVSVTGNKKLGIIEKDDGSWDVIVRDVKHADDIVAHIKVTYDAKGHITSVEAVEMEMAQEDQDVEEFLEHFGVRGMKWGVRRRQALREASSDEARAASDARDKVKKAGGTHALSNKELQELVTRMNLERQFDQLKPDSKTKKASKFVADVLVSAGKQQAQKLAQEALTKQVASLLKR